MADPVVPPADQPAVVAPVADAPVVVEAPVVTDVAPVVAETPVVAPAADAAPADKPFTPHTEVESLAASLAPEPEKQPETTEPTTPKEGDKPAEVKAEEKAPADKPAEREGQDVKPEGDKPAAEEDKPPEQQAAPEAPVFEPIEYEYTVPEGLTLDDTLKGQFTSALDTFRKDPKKGAQQFLDMHRDQVVKFFETELRRQHEDFANTRKGWRTEVMADPIIGGAGHQTALKAIANVRDMFVSDHEHRSPGWFADLRAFQDMCNITGCGDHPVFNRVLHRMSRYFSEAAPVPQTFTESAPPKNAGRQNGRLDPSVLYDNPRSPKGRQ